MRYFILCMAVLLCIAPASAGLFDFLNGPTTGIDWDKTTITDAIRNIPADDYATRQERINQGIAAKVKKEKFPIELTVNKDKLLAKNLSPLGDYYIRIDSVEYEPSTGMLKTYIYATRNGRELDIKNPVRFYGMGYTYAPDPGAANINTGKMDEKGNPIYNAYQYEDSKLAIISSIYSYLQSLDYGKVTNDGLDPTTIIYPDVDGYISLNIAVGMPHTLYKDNRSGDSGTSSTVLRSRITSHFTRVWNFTYFYRPEFKFNASTINQNWSFSAAYFQYYISNTSPVGSTYFTANKRDCLYNGFMKSTIVTANDYDNWLNAGYIACNTSVSNITGSPTVITITNPMTNIYWSTTQKYVTYLLRNGADIYTPSTFSYGMDQGWELYSVTYAGTAYDPFLRLEYTVTDICPTGATATTTPVCTSPVSENAQVPVTMMYLLIPLAMGLSLFAVWSYDNRVYANIVLGGFASSVLWFFLAASVITGNIFLCSANRKCVLTDTPLFWMYVLFGIIMIVYTIALSIEAIMERNVQDLGGEEE